MQLPWSKDRKIVQDMTPYRCFCGEYPVVASWEAWDRLTGETGHIYGFSCETPDCGGNLKERWGKTLSALRRLSSEERILLGLLYKGDFDGAVFSKPSA